MRLVSGLSGTPTERPKSWNCPGPIFPSGPLPVQVIVSTRSVTCSPSSFVTGCASFFLTTLAVQPGTGWVDTNWKPAGNCTSTLTVDASSRSFGTRTSSRVKPPAGTSSGWSVT